MKIIPDYIPEELENLSIEDVPDTINAVALENVKMPLAGKITELDGKTLMLKWLAAKHILAS